MYVLHYCILHLFSGLLCHVTSPLPVLLPLDCLSSLLSLLHSTPQHITNKMSHQHSHQHAPSPQPHQPHSHSSHSHGHTHQHHPSAPPPPYTPPPPPAGLLPLTSPRPTSENLHRATVCATFDLYRLSSLSSNQRRRADYYSLSPTHQALLPGYKELLAAVDERLEGNSRFVKDVIEVNPFAPEQEGEGGEAALEAEAPGEADHEVRFSAFACNSECSELIFCMSTEVEKYPQTSRQGLEYRGASSSRARACCLLKDVLHSYPQWSHTHTG